MTVSEIWFNWCFGQATSAESLELKTPKRRVAPQPTEDLRVTPSAPQALPQALVAPSPVARRGSFVPSSLQLPIPQASPRSDDGSEGSPLPSPKQKHHYSVNEAWEILK